MKTFWKIAIAIMTIISWFITELIGYLALTSVFGSDWIFKIPTDNIFLTQIYMMQDYHSLLNLMVFIWSFITAYAINRTLTYEWRKDFGN